MMCGMSMVPVSAKNASAKDCSMAQTWVMTSNRCRFTRSTITPANGASRKDGTLLANATMPRRNGDELR